MISSAARCRVCWLVVLFCLANSNLLLAQSTGGRILGRVADPSGAVLAGVKITLVNEATGVSRETQTNDSGDFAFIEVPVGTYRAEFDLTGFKKNVRRGHAKHGDATRRSEGSRGSDFRSATGGYHQHPTRRRGE